MRNKKLDRVIKKLYFSTTLRRELREEPTAVASRFGLSDSELKAVQSGDAQTLVTAGMDPRLVTNATPTVIDKLRLRAHQVVAFGLVVAGMLAFAPFASASARFAPRIGRRVGRRAGRRISARYVLGRVRARVLARAGEVQARRAVRRVRARMLERGDGDILKPQLQNDPVLSLQDPIQ